VRFDNGLCGSYRKADDLYSRRLIQWAKRKPSTKARPSGGHHGRREEATG
jgi:hypothetical protein